MKVLVTGANGFVGSHILDALRERHVSVRILLRHTSDTSFIKRHLNDVEIHYGSLSDPESLADGVDGVQAIIHCAGKTKVVRTEQYYEVNQKGTANLVEVTNRQIDPIDQFIHISSRSVLGPSRSNNPATEKDLPRPISDYGKSKLLAEREVTEKCKVPWTVLRPSAVYGPRDTDFFHAFKTVHNRLMPLFDGGTQQINLIYGPDLADAVLECLGEADAFTEIYNVASPHISTSRGLLEEIARQMNVQPLVFSVPSKFLYPACAIQEFLSNITGKPSIFSRQKYHELQASGWVCSIDKIRRELGYVAETTLSEGVAKTLRWYEEHGWL
ncbi:MAG: NAD-dependent epimerase/dehydratase family protein [Candidatus Brocadiia bacterium]